MERSLTKWSLTRSEVVLLASATAPERVFVPAQALPVPCTAGLTARASVGGVVPALAHIMGGGYIMGGGPKNKPNPRK